MTVNVPDTPYDLRQVKHAAKRELSRNECFWIEVIRLASWDTDPAPTLESAQKVRQIFAPKVNGRMIDSR